MTAEERIAHLELELAQERAKTARVEAENASLRQRMEHILARLHEVEGRLAKDSHNSSKPPSSDSPRRQRQGQARGAGSKREDSPGILAGP